MVTQYGMTGFGYAQVDADTLRVGGEVAARAHAHVDALLQEAHATATALLAQHPALLEAVADALLLDETLDGPQVFALVAEHSSPAHSTPAHASPAHASPAQGAVTAA
jgi:cell division protease FtsH